ncbi:carboxylating nicotinate-nucleotide diphosphorylase [bacterium]|nr:carboxylating nicotinate-nucleotide diphosphorylase [bacterium]
MKKKIGGLNLKKIRPVVRRALEEDVGKGDITTLLTVPKEKNAKGIIRAKEKGVIAGLPVAELAFQQVAGRPPRPPQGGETSPRARMGETSPSAGGSRVVFKARVKEGEKVKKGQAIAEVIGDARSILTAERTALNFLQKLSGIATLTNRFVEKVRPYKVKIFDTRKTTPGLRYLEKYAVRCGGGYNHRIGLYDQVLIKDNHFRLQVSGFRLQDLVKKIRKRISRGMKIEVEAKNLREVREALKAVVDIIMLDNMNLKSIRKAIELCHRSPVTGYRSPIIEASGGITLENVGKIAKTGVNRISIGALTHSAKALDISLDIVT